MRIFKLKRLVSLMLAAVFCGSAVPVVAFADDGKGEPPVKPAAAAKIEAPAPLTERERWLLDRVEQLEKRVSDLEAKGNATTLPAGYASAAHPASANATASVGAASPSLVSGATPAHSDSLSNDRVAVLGPQATERGKSGAAKTPATEPFAFADFTWLNGNARTKESPMDTKLFTPEIRADVDYIYDFNHPKDNTVSGSSEVFSADEVQVTQVAVHVDLPY